MMRRRWLLGAAAALAMAAGTAEAQNRVFRMATSVDAATLDPHATNALFTFLVVHQIYEGLTWRGDDLRVHPGLARALLAEAGYPNGFAVPMDCPVGTYDEACQAVAAMLARAGIRAQLTIHPNAVYSQRIRRQEAMLFMLSWGVPTFDASYTLREIRMD